MWAGGLIANSYKGGLMAEYTRRKKSLQNRTEQNRTLFCINISGHSQVAYEKKVYVYLVE